jgi:hypothetical protein
MSSWRYMVIRIGERCLEYGNHMDPEANIVSSSLHFLFLFGGYVY